MTKFVQKFVILSFISISSSVSLQKQKYLCESSCKDMTNTHETVDMVFTVRDRAIDQCYGMIHRKYQKIVRQLNSTETTCQVNKKMITDQNEQESWDQVCRGDLEIGCHFDGSNCICGEGVCEGDENENYGKCRINRQIFDGEDAKVELGWVQACKNVEIGCAFNGMNCLCLDGVC